MIRSLWIAKTGLDAQQMQMDVITNNLANVSTNGFKKSRAVFEDLLYQNIRQPGAQSSQQTQLPSGLQLGTGVRPVATDASTLRATCNKPATARMSPSAAKVSSRYCCLTAPPLIPATARSSSTTRAN